VTGCDFKRARYSLNFRVPARDLDQAVQPKLINLALQQSGDTRLWLKIRVTRAARPYSAASHSCRLAGDF